MPRLLFLGELKGLGSFAGQQLLVLGCAPACWSRSASHVCTQDAQLPVRPVVTALGGCVGSLGLPPAPQGVPESGFFWGKVLDSLSGVRNYLKQS